MDEVINCTNCKDFMETVFRQKRIRLLWCPKCGTVYKSNNSNNEWLVPTKNKAYA